MTDSIFRIETQESVYLYEAKTEAVALEKFAYTVGYDSYAELASTLGKTVDEAKADLVIKRGTYPEALSAIIDEALKSDAAEDGASERFATSRDWADWCMKGRTGDDAKAFAREHDLDVNAVWYAVEEALWKRDIDDINAAFGGTYEEATPSSVLFADVAGKEPLVGGDALPEQFFHHSGTGIYRYTYTGPHSYDLFERRDEGDRVIWIGCGSEQISDDTTADDLEAFLA